MTTGQVIMSVILCIAGYLVLIAMYLIGFEDGYRDRYEYKTRIEPTKIEINPATNDTTFVYIMEW